MENEAIKVTPCCKTKNWHIVNRGGFNSDLLRCEFCDQTFNRNFLETIPKIYSRISHSHCWDQKSPACGMALEKHSQCCLCDLKYIKNICPTCGADLPPSHPLRK